MGEVLAKTDCSIHPHRPATARCPSCRSYFCSECITEHDGKLTCAACLNGRAAPATEEKRRLAIPIMPVIHFSIAVAICWFTFYFIARFLTDLPDQFHDGTIWE